MRPEEKKIIQSFIAPFLMVLCLVAVKLYEIIFNVSLVSYGVFPRNMDALCGIFTGAFIHADWEHLVSNAIPILVLGGALFYFYREVAWKVVIITYVFSGFWLWLGGRENYHIGASNMVYGFAAFLFFSGIIRRHIGLIAISLLVVFLYGSMVWGLLPVVPKISWEGHLFGVLAGILCAIVFRKEGTQKVPYEWEDEDDTDDTGSSNTNDTSSPLKIIYSYKESESNQDESGKN